LQLFLDRPKFPLNKALRSYFNVTKYDISSGICNAVRSRIVTPEGGVAVDGIDRNANCP
jgi:hypothetical protein